MGIYDRDYMRDDFTPSKRRRGGPPKRRRFTFSLPLFGATVAVLGIVIAILFLLNREEAGELDHPRVDFPVDLNRAQPHELMAVPQIGPSTTEQIIKRRPFREIDELLDISGIGPTRFKTMSQFVTVGDSEPDELPESVSDPRTK